MTKIEISDRVSIEIRQDSCPESPAEWDNLGTIAYSSRRYTLGTENVSKDRLDEIRDGIKKGTLIGLPVWAYIHGGARIKAADANPFHCPWDSGQSGFVYCTKQAAIKEFGTHPRMTKAVKEAALSAMRSEVETFSQYLEGDVWVVRWIVEGEEVEAVHSVFGHSEAVALGRSYGEACGVTA